METIELLNILSDETRLKILGVLTYGEKCVCEIIPATGKGQSNVSIQLLKMLKAGILESRKKGKKVFYKIKDYRVCEIFKILEYTSNVNKSCCCKNC